MVSTCDHTWSLFSVPSTIYWNRAGSYCIHTKKFYSVESRVSQFHSETRQPLAFWPGISQCWARLEDWLLKKGFLFLTDFCFRKHLQSGSAVCLVLSALELVQKSVSDLSRRPFPKLSEGKGFFAQELEGSRSRIARPGVEVFPTFHSLCRPTCTFCVFLLV